MRRVLDMLLAALLMCIFASDGWPAQKPTTTPTASSSHPSASVQADRVSLLMRLYIAINSLPENQRKSILSEANQYSNESAKKGGFKAVNYGALEKNLRMLMMEESAKGPNFSEQVLRQQLPSMWAKEVSKNSLMQLMDVVNGRFPPYLPTPSGLEPVKRDDACAKDEFSTDLPTVNANLGALSKMVASVGRVETQGTPDSTVGTAFVISAQEGLLATACHVISNIANQDRKTGTWTLIGNPIVDFGGTTSEGSLGQEFEVTGIAFVPEIGGCDGGLIRVRKTARDHRSALPPSLPRADGKLYSYATMIDVGTIGYPDMTANGLRSTTIKTQLYFNCLHTRYPKQAKFVFGGWAWPIKQSQASGFRIINHLAPTTGNQSGSPIIAITDHGTAVIGIHFCCAAEESQSPPYTYSGPHACEDWSVDAYQGALDLADLLQIAIQNGINLGNQGNAVGAMLIPWAGSNSSRKLPNKQPSKTVLQ